MPAAALPVESTKKKQNEKTEKKNVKETQNEKHKKRNATTAATQAAPPPPPTAAATATATATAAVTATTINWQSVPLKKQLHRHTQTHTPCKHIHVRRYLRESAPERETERESVAWSSNSISVLPCCTLSNVDVLQADTLSLSLVCLALFVSSALSARYALSLSCSAARRSAPAKPTHNKKPILLLKCLRLCLSFVFGFLLGSHLVLIV